MFLCDNIGLVSLIFLGLELRVSYITVLCIQGNLILSPLLFMPSLHLDFILLVCTSEYAESCSAFSDHRSKASAVAIATMLA